MGRVVVAVSSAAARMQASSTAWSPHWLASSSTRRALRSALCASVRAFVRGEQGRVEAVGVGNAGLGDHGLLSWPSAVRKAEAMISGVAFASTAAR